MIYSVIFGVVLWTAAWYWPGATAAVIVAGAFVGLIKLIKGAP